MYDDKLINTDIKKNTMRKFIKNTYKKSAFSFDNIIYEHTHGISMRLTLPSVHFNIS